MLDSTNSSTRRIAISRSRNSPSAVEFNFAGQSFRLSGSGLFLTENQVRAMIGGGAEKPVEQAFGAVGDARRSRRAASQRWT